MRLIDADALKAWVEEQEETKWGLSTDEVWDAIDDAPPIEPKKGKWIRHVLKNANVPWGYDCSACGAWFVVGEDTAKKYYYCPNCGARMERSEE